MPSTATFGTPTCTELLATTTTTTTLVPPTTPSEECGPNYFFDEDSNRCYRYKSDFLSWDDASSDCQGEGGHLISFHNAAEERVVIGEESVVVVVVIVAVVVVVIIIIDIIIQISSTSTCLRAETDSSCGRGLADRVDHSSGLMAPHSTITTSCLVLYCDS